MKQNSIESLLEKYREGTLSETERAELEQLTHKDEVTAAACRQATGIVRRRLALAVSVLMIGGAGVWSVLPGSTHSSTLASLGSPSPSLGEELRMTLTEETETLTPGLPTEQVPLVAEVKAIKPVQGSSPKLGEVAAHRADGGVCHASEPVVVCNNQCDADSVINDIKKFLSV